MSAESAMELTRDDERSHRPGEVQLLFLRERSGYCDMRLRVDDAPGPVTFETSSPAVAAIADAEPGDPPSLPCPRYPRCLVQAVGMGFATITARSGDETASMEIEVKESLRDAGFDWF